jgi:hypothetical protein
MELKQCEIQFLTKVPHESKSLKRLVSRRGSDWTND